jgi:hypothetical protein
MVREFGIDRTVRYAIPAGLIFFEGNSPAWAQATSRPCVERSGEQPGPACLMAHQSLGKLSGAAVH